MAIINWIRPYLGLTTPQLASLFNILKGDPELTSSRKLASEAKPRLELVERAITNRQAYRMCPKVCVVIFIVFVGLHPMGIIGQWDTQWSDSLHILE